MIIINQFQKEELEILKQNNIEIKNKDYSLSELFNLEDEVAYLIADSVENKNKVEILEKILDKILDLEDK